MATSDHDLTMLAALSGVKYGHYNSSFQFVKDVRKYGVRTERQRWWLTTLVVRHRKQISNQSAVSQALRWLKDHPQHAEQPRKQVVQQQVLPPQVALVPTLFNQHLF